MIVLMVILVWSYPVQSFPTVPRIVSNSIVIRVRRQTPNNSTTIDSKLPNVQSTTTLNPTISTKDLKWPSWMCNYTSYPTDGCSPLVHAYCETQSNTCICRSSSTSTTTNTNRPNQKKYCLSPVQLGHQCQSSGQCRSIDPNSACFMMDGIVTDWRCRCIDGNLPMNDGRCDTNSTSTYDNYDRIQYEHCASKGMVWIVGLKRCVNRSTLPFYANRGVGRAGGGRGGGGGGHGRGSVGGRSSAALAAIVIANEYGHGYHHCYPKVTVKHHTVPKYVPYTVYEKYPIYKYEKYPVHVPVKYPVYVKEEKYHGHGYDHGYGHDEHEAYHDEPAKKASDSGTALASDGAAKSKA
ncbi:hypothetical protein RDWZM_009316 [Blomia tropicalis]|uniref:EB domain-containing protein n=1 Tax=Blomia tropicalis TaxID=40697 RepID=A0A9Q0M350_BLOTA|nr:hypothetical protein RDWZM_009316 [Blomia tropicalis]